MSAQYSVSGMILRRTG